MIRLSFAAGAPAVANGISETLGLTFNPGTPGTLGMDATVTATLAAGSAAAANGIDETISLTGEYGGATGDDP